MSPDDDQYLDEDQYQVEYVTGGINLPVWGIPPAETAAHISLLNLGSVAAVGRAFILRGTGLQGIGAVDTVFDNEQTFDIHDVLAKLGPKEEWDTMWELYGADATPTVAARFKYWFRILVTSPRVIPSIEVIAQSRSANPASASLNDWVVVARYTIGDFAVFHHPPRIDPGQQPVGQIQGG